jgi:lipopolysaccharide transport system ATP-binding protein
MLQNDIAIRVSNISKKYIIGKQKDSSLRGSLQGVFNRKLAQGDEFLALNDVSFDIKKGDIVGVIGKNGAGKSTLLKVLSQITKPSTGRIEINGRIASLLEVGTGFHPELTGRENIYLNGTILGMSRKEVSSKFDEIVEFSGVEKFIDTPVKHYSSGMYVRLAFAVAAHLEPEILIIDEVLAVGDAEFQKKCLGKMQDVAQHGRTVIFVSHNMSSVKALCNRGIVIQKGALVFNSEIQDAIDYYQIQNVKTRSTKFKMNSDSPKINDSVELIDFDIVPRKGSLLTMLSGIDFILKFYSYVENKTVDLTFEVVNQDDVIVFHNGATVTAESNSEIGEYLVTCSLPEQLLNAGIYSVNLIFGENQRFLLKHYEDIISFEVLQEIVGSNSSKLPGIVFPKLEVVSEKITV